MGLVPAAVFISLFASAESSQGTLRESVLDPNKCTFTSLGRVTEQIDATSEASDTTLTNSQFALSTSRINDPRPIQLGTRMTF